MKIFTSLLLCFLIFFLAYPALAQSVPDDIEISLITCSPGNELYTTFGHSYIRLYVPSQQIDVVFAPNFERAEFRCMLHYYWKFLDGRSEYRATFQPTKIILLLYQYNKNRWLAEEKIRLKKQEKHRLFLFLQNNQDGENSEYLYNFFYNNCSTKIWKIIKNQIQQPLYFDLSTYKPLTFRQMLFPYLEKHPWIKFGINCCLGIPADKIADFEEQMYLPDYLSRHMRHTFREQPFYNARSLLGPRKILVEKTRKSEKNVIIEPGMVFWMLFGFTLLLTFLPFPRILQTGIDCLIYSSAGLIGLYLMFLWWHSHYQVMDDNLDLLWASPLALAIVVAKLFSREKLNQYLIGLYVISIVILLAGWSVLPQQFSPHIIPICLILLSRLIANKTQIIRSQRAG